MKTFSKLRRVLIVGLSASLVIAIAVLWRRPGNQAASTATRLPSLENLNLLPVDANSLALLRPELSEALDANGPAALQQRLDLLAAVSGALNQGECAALLHALLEPRGVNIPAGWHAEYVHNIARLLQGAGPVRDDFARALATLARDGRRDETVRDYALQHLRQVWDRSGQERRPAIEATFRELASEESGVSDSALLSLHLLGKAASPLSDVFAASSPGHTEASGFRLPDSELEPLVSRILQSAPSAETIKPRLTALRIVGDRRMKSFHEKLRAMASDTGKEHALVRMAAIANLAAFADPSDRPLLESLASSRDPRVNQAAKRALALNR